MVDVSLASQVMGAEVGRECHHHVVLVLMKEATGLRGLELSDLTNVELMAKRDNPAVWIILTQLHLKSMD